MDSIYSAFTNAERATLDNEAMRNELALQPLKQQQLQGQVNALNELVKGRQFENKTAQETYDRQTGARKDIAAGMMGLPVVDRTKPFAEQQAAIGQQLNVLQGLLGKATEAGLPGEEKNLQGRIDALQKSASAAQAERVNSLYNTARLAHDAGPAGWKQFIDSIPATFPEYAKDVLQARALGINLDDPKSPQVQQMLGNMQAAVVGQKERLDLENKAADREEKTREAKAREQNEARRIGIADRQQTLAEQKYNDEKNAAEAAGNAGGGNASGQGGKPAKEGTIERRYNKNLQRGYSEVTALTGALTSLPEFSSSGIFQGEDSKGLLTAPLGVITKRLAGTDANKYNATMGQVVRQIGLIANGGMKPDKSSLESLEKKFMFTPGESAESKLYKMALIRQEVHAAANTDLSDEVIPQSRKDDIKRSLDSLDKLIPFTTADVQAKFGKKGERKIGDMLKSVPSAASSPKQDAQTEAAAFLKKLGP